jgi:Yip1 domain
MNLIARAKAILLDPATEWPVIERESGDVSYLFKNYVAILALIPAVAGFIGMSFVGISVPLLGTMRIPIFSGLVGAIVGYAFSFVALYIVAHIIDALATTFGGQKNFGNALKLAVYSYTPFWIAGVFMIIPVLAFLTLLGLYGFYLLYLGLPALMKTPKERALVYAVAVVVCAFVIGIVLGAIQSAVLSSPR